MTPPRRCRGDLWRDQDGSSLLFGAFTLFAGVSAAILVMDAWEAVRARIQAQGAADAASFSASALLANAYGMVAALNDTLVWLYKAALLLIASVVVSGALVALNAVLPGAFLWALPLFEQSLAAANTWLPRIREYSERIANVQDRIVQGAPAMMQAEALRIARANGAEGAFLSSAQMHLVREYRFDRFADKISGGSVPSWALSWLFPGRGLRMGAEGYQRWEEYQEARGERIGQRIEDPRLRQRFRRFLGIVRELEREPLPLPFVLTPRYLRSSVQAVAWTPVHGLRERPPSARAVAAWPQGIPEILWTVANTRPSHPKLEGTDLDGNLENLYVERGWTVDWMPVDLRRRAGRERREFGGIARELEGWIEH